MDTPLFIAARFIIKHRPRADRLPNASRRGMYLLPAHNSLGYSEAKFLLCHHGLLFMKFSDRVVILILEN